jgi:PPK2 family polyphosphate:nucleotide phosphotransferase
MEVAMAKIDTDDYRVRPGKKVRLDEWPTKGKPVYSSDKEHDQLLREHIGKLSELQNLLYATNRYALLLIFQAMDAAGKDSAIKNVMSGVNPQGCQVFSFKHPSTEELQHDFLWNAIRRLPERGHIGIFNRSYYEEVLIVRVHREILSNEDLPEELVNRKHFWRDRYRSIQDLEDHLYRNGTRILKFFLHLSKGEQKKRFLKRIDDPDKNWKFSADDIKERKYWKNYMTAFEECLSATSTQTAPWYIVPADDKENTGLIISRTIVDALESLKMSYPKSTPQRHRELLGIRKQLVKE